MLVTLIVMGLVLLLCNVISLVKAYTTSQSMVLIDVAAFSAEFWDTAATAVLLFMLAIACTELVISCMIV